LRGIVDVINKITPVDISDPQEVVARAEALGVELGTRFRQALRPWCSRPRAASRTSEFTYFGQDGSRFPAVVSSRRCATRRTPSSLRNHGQLFTLVCDVTRL
jgi:hypothetical protein